MCEGIAGSSGGELPMRRGRKANWVSSVGVSGVRWRLRLIRSSGIWKIVLETKSGRSKRVRDKDTFCSVRQSHSAGGRMRPSIFCILSEWMRWMRWMRWIQRYPAWQVRNPKDASSSPSVLFRSFPQKFSHHRRMVSLSSDLTNSFE